MELRQKDSLPNTHNHWPWGVLSAAALTLSIAFFLLFELRPGQEWDGDFGLYFMNAINIVRGLPYGQTAYLFNPANAVEPAAYPAGLPLLLAPIVYFRGVDLHAAKVECIVTLAMFLGIYWIIARESIGTAAALFTAALFGLHPFITESTNTPASEFPYLLFSYSSLLLFHRLQAEPTETRLELIFYVLLTGAVTAMAYATRSVGILLLPAAMASALGKKRTSYSSTLWALIVAAVLSFAIQLRFHADVGTYVHYFDQFQLHMLLTNSMSYLDSAVHILGKSRIAVACSSALLLAGAAGFLSRVRSLTVFESYFALYVGLLVVYPITLEVRRYEMPLWPLLFMYCARGVQLVTNRFRPVQRRLILIAVLVLTTALWVKQFRALDFSPIPYSVTAKSSAELFTALRQLPGQPLILTRKPTIVALYTGHVSTIWPDNATESGLWEYVRAKRVTYVVEDLPQMGMSARHINPLTGFIAHNQPYLQRTFANQWFNVYRITSLPAD
jgi:hypothetical protein